MTIRLFAATIVALATHVMPCAGQDYCGLLQQEGAVGLRPLRTSADDIVKDLGDSAPFSPTSFTLQAARNPSLKSQGAAAQICNGNQRYIFYDPDFIESLRNTTGTDWPKYFTFAHEIAHHVNGDTLLHHESEIVELQADRSAAYWLTRRGATLKDILNAINSLGFSDVKRRGYPTRCERRAAAILAYNDIVVEYNSRGTNLLIYEACECRAVEAGGGLYAAKAIAAKAPILAPDLISCAAPLPSAGDVPKTFTHDVAGMCALTPLQEGDRVTWKNIGVCSLMR